MRVLLLRWVLDVGSRVDFTENFTSPSRGSQVHQALQAVSCRHVIVYINDPRRRLKTSLVTLKCGCILLI